ncbi:MAG: energy transducer TonB [Ramlibacter sp.]|nr:energy transducer TonB [Ramlibacter sp.]
MVLADSPLSPVRLPSRNIVIGGTVVLLHVAALWALQSGLLRRAVEIVVPVEMLTELVTPPAPKVEPPPALPPAPPQVSKPVVRKAAPRPLAAPAVRPEPQAPMGVVTPEPVPPIAEPVAPAPAPPAPPPAPRIELPSSSADYLQNPKPAYPPISKRLGEQGKVVHSVLIGADGMPISAKLVHSSGYPRLDEAAHAAVMRWRYMPGKRNGVAQAMSFEVPINWVLD